jgi:hypothetical protein
MREDCTSGDSLSKDVDLFSARSSFGFANLIQIDIHLVQIQTYSTLHEVEDF